MARFRDQPPPKHQPMQAVRSAATGPSPSRSHAWAATSFAVAASASTPRMAAIASSRVVATVPS